jgi:hypothetical protein
MVNEHYLKAVLQEHSLLRQEFTAIEKLFNSSMTWFAALLAGSIWFGFSSAKPIPAGLVLLFFFPLLGMILFFLLQYYNSLLLQLGEYILWLERKYSLVLPQTEVPELLQKCNDFARNYSNYEDHDLVSKALIAPLGWESLARVRWDKQINAVLFLQLKNIYFYLVIVAVAGLPGFAYLLDKGQCFFAILYLGALIFTGRVCHPKALRFVSYRLVRPLDSPFVNPWVDKE